MVYTSRWLSGTCIPIIHDVRLCVTSRNVIYEADLVKMKGRAGQGRTGLLPPCEHPCLYGGWEVNISMILLMAPETFPSFESIAFIQLDKPQLCSSQTKLQYMIKQEPQALPKKTNTIKGPIWALIPTRFPRLTRFIRKTHLSVWLGFGLLDTECVQKDCSFRSVLPHAALINTGHLPSYSDEPGGH